MSSCRNGFFRDIKKNMPSNNNPAENIPYDDDNNRNSIIYVLQQQITDINVRLTERDADIVRLNSRVSEQDAVIVRLNS